MRRLVLRSVVLLVMSVLSTSAVSAQPAPSTNGLARRDVAFAVNNIEEQGAARTIRGFRIDPSCRPRTVVLLQHGLSYTSAAWDFDPDYSTARTIADGGYAVVAIDRLGYGQSELDNGRAVSVAAYASMTHQIVTQLRKEFDHVVVGGHSAGAEATETMVGMFGGADAVLALAYHQFPAPGLVAQFVLGDTVRALLDDYEYFLGTPAQRAAWFYTASAEPRIVAADKALAAPTPSGEILTIGTQPSRYWAPVIRVPVFLQLAEGDRLFPVKEAAHAARWFTSAPSVTLDIVPDAGHTFMLHPTGRDAARRTAAWLRSLRETPPC